MQTKRLELRLGPQQLPVIGPMRFLLESDGEVVYSGQPEVGFLHRGIEKIAERTTWLGFMPYTDRIDYVSSIHCNLAYALAIEKLAKIQVSERADAIRVIVSELNRINSHLLSIGMVANSFGLKTGFQFALRDREKINNLFEMLCGSRLTFNYIRIGGVAADLTEGFIEKTNEFIEYILSKLKEYNDLLSNNKIFIGRLRGVGVLTSQQAIDAGVSGPILRSSGVKFDVRKNESYCGYEKYDFDIPIGTGEFGFRGDSFERFFIKIREIEQSVMILRQAIDQLPHGTVQTTLPKVFKVPTGETYISIESSRGLFGVYIKSSGEKNPLRVKFRTPSFAVLNLFPKLLENVSISDVSAIIGSLDIMVSEVDR